MNKLKTIFGIIALIITITTPAQNILVVQAEDGIFTGKTETEHSGNTGSGFVDTENNTGSYIQFEFSIKEAG